MQLFNFLCSLALRFKLLRHLSRKQGPGKSHAVGETDRADIHLQRGDSLGGFIPVMALRGYRVHDHENRRPGRFDETQSVCNRLYIENGRTAGDQDKIGRLGRLKSRAVGMRSRIKKQHLATGLLDPFHFMRQPTCMN